METEQNTEKRTKNTRYINVKKIKELAKEHGKRTSAEFIALLDSYVHNAVARACSVHDGGAKTLSEIVLATVLKG